VLPTSLARSSPLPEIPWLPLVQLCYARAGLPLPDPIVIFPPASNFPSRAPLPPPSAFLPTLFRRLSPPPSKKAFPATATVLYGGAVRPQSTSPVALQDNPSQTIYPSATATIEAASIPPEQSMANQGGWCPVRGGFDPDKVEAHVVCLSARDLRVVMRVLNSTGKISANMAVERALALHVIGRKNISVSTLDPSLMEDTGVPRRTLRSWLQPLPVDCPMGTERHL